MYKVKTVYCNSSKIFPYRAKKKAVSSFLLISNCLLIFSHVDLVVGNETIYEFGEYCLSFPNDIDNDDELYVEYNGKPVSFIWDTFAFRGGGDLDDIFDECSTCVTPLYINDSNCAVALNIKTSLLGVTKHKITCTENKSTKFCGAQNETIYIEFKNRNSRESSTSGTKFKTTDPIYLLLHLLPVPELEESLAASLLSQFVVQYSAGV